MLGAPDVLFVSRENPDLDRALDAEGVSAGRRILVLAGSASQIQGVTLPAELSACGILVLDEQLRANAVETVRYLLAQGVTVKVLSGDDPLTVAAVAKRVGVSLVAAPFDAQDLPSDQSRLAELAERTDVFGRVRPSQKRDIIAALQSRAMSSQ